MQQERNTTQRTKEKGKRARRGGHVTIESHTSYTVKKIGLIPNPQKRFRRFQKAS